MRRVLLASVCLLCLSDRAHAQGIPVYDNVSNLLHTQEIMKLVSQLETAVQTLNTARQQYEVARQTYDAFTKVTDLSTAVSALNMIGIRNPLPISASAAQALIEGRGGTQGMLASLNGLYTGTAAANRVYEADNGTWVGQDLNRRFNGSAGTQAIAMQSYASAGQRTTLLDQLRARIAATTDPSERADLSNRIAVENAQLQNEALQLQAVAIAAAQEREMNTQRQEQRIQQGIDRAIETARAQGIPGA